jgi:hypothetical protein
MIRDGAGPSALAIADEARDADLAGSEIKSEKLRAPATLR